MMLTWLNCIEGSGVWMSKIIYRKPEKEDVIQVLSLLSSNDPSMAAHFNERYWQWQFEKIPLGSEQVIACVGDEVVGCCEYLRFRANINTQNEIVYESVEAVVKTQYRGRGIFTGLMNTFYKTIRNINSTYGFCSPLSFKIFTTKLDHKYYGDMNYWIGLTDLRSILIKKNIVIPRSFSAIFRLFEIKKCYDNIENTIKLDKFEKCWDCVSNWNYDCRFYLIKDSAFLNWRYVDHPYNKYDIYAVYEKEQPCGFIVLKGHNIVDIGYADIRHFESLIAYAIHYFIQNKVQMINSYLCLETQAVKVINKYGFHKINYLQHRPFAKPFYPRQRTIVMSKDGKNKFPLLSKWFFTMGDMDCKL